ncbi:hypothetical protein K505DRAFT_390063 [Melanomma pulvis-pyrius CBS 109.77]|uniref:Uncharacterized protein n=1 Tax=Melanomma pulvis-pyrius CBS 109.77 TaxID=1314802 RepID=A0A6A6XRJ9_9PLEO|nr:hypothetical protein K505DRAFT_390063 [Melanomma pulvis-pyrius CBS 109.77]
MASTFTEMPTFSTARAVPIPGITPLHSHINLRDRVRIVLFLAIPIYARIYLFSSISVAFGHIYVIGCTGVCIVHFSNGIIGLGTVRDIIYGLFTSSFPGWSTSILRILWVGSSIEGWRWEIVYWTFVGRQLTYLLPKYYGSDVEALIEEYRNGYPQYERNIFMISGAIVYMILWPKGCSWYDAMLMTGILRCFIQYGYLLCLNYAHLRIFGMTARQDLWTYRDMYVRYWMPDAQGNPIRVSIPLSQSYKG